VSRGLGFSFNRLGARHMIHAVRHKVPKALKLELLVRLRLGQ